MKVRRRLTWSRPQIFIVALFVIGLMARHAGAVIKQPDGTIIPVDSSLPYYLDSAGDPAIDVVKDAAITPETFKPACSIKFTLLSRGDAVFQDIFGWYNATGTKPAVSDLHVILDCSSPPKSVDVAIRKDPAYKGGKVGFFLVTPQDGGFGDCPSLPTDIGNVGGGSKNAIYFSEAALNPDSAAATKSIHLLIYDSKAFKPAFYFAWEDLYSGGDNNFTDFIARVDNIVCAAAGEPCDTGKLGVCQFGSKSCVEGKEVCVDSVKAGAKKCNGLDNDCDGKVDDGPCPDGTICTKGACIPKCGTGEFKCGGGQVCDLGVCVDPPCVGKTCPGGSTCVAGECVDPCTGAKCPFGTVCRTGICVNPCAGIACGGDEVCEGGFCRAACTCGGCPTTGTSCDTVSKLCVPSSCVGKTCAPGSHCGPDGSCVDDCVGAVCPAGFACKSGACVPSAGASDAGSDALADTDSGPAVADASPMLDGSFGAEPAEGASDGPDVRGTCRCTTPGHSTTRDWTAFFGAAVGAYAFSSRRRRRRH